MSGYSETEAKNLVGRAVETVSPLAFLPPGSRGRVVGAERVDMHWEVLVAWLELAGRPITMWWTWLTKEQVETKLQDIPDESPTSPAHFRIPLPHEPHSTG